MNIRNKIFENFGLKEQLKLIGVRNRLKERLDRLKIYFPERIEDLEKNLSFLTDEEITGLENNTPIRYVLPGIYIKEIDYTHIPTHNIENIEDYINESDSQDAVMVDMATTPNQPLTIGREDTINMLISIGDYRAKEGTGYIL